MAPCHSCGKRNASKKCCSCDNVFHLKCMNKTDPQMCLTCTATSEVGGIEGPPQIPEQNTEDRRRSSRLRAQPDQLQPSERVVRQRFSEEDVNLDVLTTESNENHGDFTAPNVPSPELHLAETLSLSSHAVAQSDTGQNNDGELEGQPTISERSVPENTAERTRRRFLEIARDRAEHFANFNDGNESRTRRSRNTNLRTETESEQWPGPFSTARQLALERPAIAAAREENIATFVEGKKEDVSVEWKPSRGNSINFSREIFVEPLAEKCLRLLAEYSECISTMKGIPDVLLGRISAAFCKRRKMSPSTLKLLAMAAKTELSVADCSAVSEVDLVEALTSCSPQDIEVLELNFSGRCISDETIPLALNPLSNLKILSLKGAYRLTDNGLKKILESCPSLLNLDVSYCSALTEDSVLYLSKTVGKTLESLTLKGLEKIQLEAISPWLSSLTNLKRLDLMRVGGVKDKELRDLLKNIGAQLVELNLESCRDLTDEGIESVSVFCPSLHSLNVDRIPGLSDASLVHLANGCREIRCLSLKLGHFSDYELGNFVAASGSSLRQLSVNSIFDAGNRLMVALASHSKGSLEVLDVSFCRNIGDEALGLVADSCHGLKKIIMFGCSQVTSKFFDGHSNSNLEVIGRGDDDVPVIK